MSIWSSVGIGEGEVLACSDEEGQESPSVMVDIATAWHDYPIRLLLMDVPWTKESREMECYLPREAAERIRDRLTAALEKAR